MINRCDRIYVERKERIELSGSPLPRPISICAQIIDRIGVGLTVGRRIDKETQPDGGRPPAGWKPRQCHHPAAGGLDGPCMSDSPVRRKADAAE